MKAFDNSEFERYKAEAQERWGNTDAYKEHAEKTRNYGKDKWSSLVTDMDTIFSEFAICMKNSNIPDSFKKIDIVNVTKKPWRNKEGFVIMGMKYFLLNADSLEF